MLSRASYRSCVAIRTETLPLRGVFGRFLLRDFFINNVRLDGLPGRNHFRMSWAVRECRALPNYDFAATARAGIDAELGVDLAILRHKTPQVSTGTSLANDQHGFNSMYYQNTSDPYRQAMTQSVMRI